MYGWGTPYPTSTYPDVHVIDVSVVGNRNVWIVPAWNAGQVQAGKRDPARPEIEPPKTPEPYDVSRKDFRPSRFEPRNPTSACTPDGVHKTFLSFFPTCRDPPCLKTVLFQNEHPAGPAHECTQPPPHLGSLTQINGGGTAGLFPWSCRVSFRDRRPGLGVGDGDCFD